jgi:plasmid stabilization system protein ParE
LSRVLFRPPAAAELDEAYRWYERERAGLGDEFLQAAETLIARVAENPLAFPLVHLDKRREVFRRFPYRLIYRVVGRMCSYWRASLVSGTGGPGTLVDGG